MALNDAYIEIALCLAILWVEVALFVGVARAIKAASAPVATMRAPRAKGESQSPPSMPGWVPPAARHPDPGTDL
jgi:hypothetical protein